MRKKYSPGEAELTGSVVTALQGSRPKMPMVLDVKPCVLKVGPFVKQLSQIHLLIIKKKIQTTKKKI